MYILEPDGEVFGEPGKSVTLKCPIQEGTTTNLSLVTREWKTRVPNNATEYEVMASLTTRGKTVLSNYSLKPNRMWISSLAGDLTLRDLKSEDAGIYRCSFLGFSDKILRLSISG